MLIKIVFCLTRKEHLTREQFQDYWLNIHVSKVKAVQHLIGLTRYVQSHTIENDMSAALRASRGGKAPYDGVMEGWIETEESEANAAADGYLEAAQMLLDDEGEFIDFERSAIFITREHVIF